MLSLRYIIMGKTDRQLDFDAFVDEQNRFAPTALTMAGLGIDPHAGTAHEAPPCLDPAAVDNIAAGLKAAFEEAGLDTSAIESIDLKTILNANIGPLLRKPCPVANEKTYSMLDVVTLGLTEAWEVKKFLKVHGVDLTDKADLAYISGVLNEAIEFYDKVVTKPGITKIHRSLQDTDTEEGIVSIFQTAAGKKQRQLVPEACALLRIAAAIDFLNRDPLLAALPHAEEALKEICREHFEIRNGKEYFTTRAKGDIPMEIIRHEIRTKIRQRIIAKLLHKPSNKTQEVLDHIGIRVTTKSAFGALCFIYQSFYNPQTAIFPGITVNPGETSQRLLNQETLLEALGDPDKAQELVRQLSITTVDHEELITIDDDDTSENPFSSKNYKAIHLTFELPLILPNGQRISFPIEIQVVDFASSVTNQAVASHPDYVERQTQAVRSRVCGHNLLTEFEDVRKKERSKGRARSSSGVRSRK